MHASRLACIVSNRCRDHQQSWAGSNYQHAYVPGPSRATLHRASRAPLVTGRGAPSSRKQRLLGRARIHAVALACCPARDLACTRSNNKHRIFGPGLRRSGDPGLSRSGGDEAVTTNPPGACRCGFAPAPRAHPATGCRVQVTRAATVSPCRYTCWRPSVRACTTPRVHR